MAGTILLSVMAASALALPQAGASFPTAVLAAKKGSDGVAVVRLFVSPDRTVESCKVVASDFSANENDGICAKLVKKKAAKAARDQNGQPVYGTLPYLVAGIDDDTSLRLLLGMPADFVLNVNDLPDGAGRKSVIVNVVAGTDGKVTHCEAVKGEESAFSETACAQLDQQEWLVRQDTQGSPVRYVDTLRVDFVDQQAGL